MPAKPVRTVIITHSHFDHAGGNTYRNEAGEVLLYDRQGRLRDRVQP